MLKVQLTQDIINVTEYWINERPGIRQSKLESAHATALFVGRDLEEMIGDKMRRVVQERKHLAPRKVTFLGRFAMFGGRRDHMVATIASPELELFHEALQMELHGLIVKPDFRFSPHITLATGRPGDTGPRPVMKRFELDVERIDVKIGPIIHREAL